MANPDPRRGDEPGDPDVTPSDGKSLDDEKAGPQIAPATPHDDDSDKGTHPPTVDD